eukprot:JP446863.1.p2 GENE.JP446863.1~~JP446863.1.p2  ORF type:complete len:127 (-),score=45.99 JP446863.1:213-593(-)
MICFAYPMYRSFKALETKEEDDDTQWLTYWVIFAYFNMLEYFVDFILSYFSYYFFVKLFFFLWLAHGNGSVKVYKAVIRPIFLKIEGPLDKAVAGMPNTKTLEKAAETVTSAVGNAAHNETNPKNE